MNELTLWIGFHLLILLLVVLDLGIFQKRPHEIKMREALVWSGVWIALSLLFNLFIYFEMGGTAALQFFTGYIVEKSLSVDNLFVFLVIFSYFRIPKIDQHKILYYGILGALVMRILFILAGSALLQRFHWMIYVFGAFLCITAIRLFAQREEEIRPMENLLVNFCKRFFRVKADYVGRNFFVRERGKLFLTPLFLTLIVIETTDLIFATDSIPAIFAITSDPFLVYTSNVFAILGLRSLYFVLADFMSRFYYLKIGLSAILLFTGLKMLFSSLFHIPIEWALLVIVVILGVSAVASILKKNDER